MSSDHYYAQFLIQKYKLAVAIAVIQTNPDTKSLDEHINDLKSKLITDKTDDLDDITLCSDDFDVDLECNDEKIININDSQISDTILKDFNDKNIPVNSELGERNQDFSDLINVINEEIQEQILGNVANTQSTLCETQPQNDVYITTDTLTDIDKTFCDSIARIHQNNIMDIDKTCDSIANIYNTKVTIDRNVDEGIDHIQNYNEQEATASENRNNDEKTCCQMQVNQHKIIDTDQTVCESITQIDSYKTTVNPEISRQCVNETTLDSQATEFYTLHCLTENYTHVSQSQNQDFNVSDKYIKGISKRNNNLVASENMDDNSQNNLVNTDFSYFKDANLVRKVNNHLDKANAVQDETYCDLNTQITTNIPVRENEQFQETQVPNTDLVYDSGDTLPINFKDLNLIRNIKRNLDNAMQVDNDNFDDYSQKTSKNYNAKENLQIQDHYSFQNTPNYETNTKNVNEINSENSVHEITKTNIENVTMQLYNFSQNDHKIIEDNNSDISEEVPQIELVPFKVIEELNRVKAYLNRRVERRMSNDSSLDSGYRSDSQGRSRSALQLSGNVIGQSAYCLYQHLTKCAIVPTTLDIVGEISEVLGQLIDRLHEEESYPSFLEELLDHVNILIRGISTDEDMVLEKDEKIQRLFLLNKSIHIQKYSIEKLTDILDNIYIRLTDKDELYELKNIQETENLSYTFHILEVLLKRYMKNKKISTNLSQSQEKCLKISISDIWRKKWNPNYKEASKIDCSVETKCVLTKCSEVLNKIVVGCMEGYSLVAFIALQCFNLLQS